MCYHLTRTSHQLPRLFWIHQCGANVWLVPRLHLLRYFSRNNKFRKGFWLSSPGVSCEHRCIYGRRLSPREATTVNTSVFASYSEGSFLLSFVGGIHVPIGRALLCLLRFIRREEPYLPWDEVLLVIIIIIIILRKMLSVWTEWLTWVTDALGAWFAPGRCTKRTPAKTVIKERRGENRSTRRKTSRSKGENQQQTQPTYGVDARIWTRATLGGGERSHHCAIHCSPCLWYDHVIMW